MLISQIMLQILNKRDIKNGNKRNNESALALCCVDLSRLNQGV